MLPRWNRIPSAEERQRACDVHWSVEVIARPLIGCTCVTHAPFASEGGFWQDKRHGRGCLEVCDGAEDILVSVFDGSFARNVRDGVGLLATCSGATLGIWHNDLLCITIGKVPELTATAYKQQREVSKEELLWRWLQRIASRSLVHSATQTGDIAPKPRPCVMVQVYSLCTLTSIPRREFTITSTENVGSLRTLAGGATVFFLGAFCIPSHYNYKYDIDAVPLDSLLPPGAVDTGPVGLCFFRCPLCTQPGGVTMPTDGGHPHFDVIECKTCAPRPTSCVYCKICAAAPNMASNALFRLDKGLKHMQTVHGLPLGPDVV